MITRGLAETMRRYFKHIPKAKRLPYIVLLPVIRTDPPEKDPHLNLCPCNGCKEVRRLKEQVIQREQQRERLRQLGLLKDSQIRDLPVSAKLPQHKVQPVGCDNLLSTDIPKVAAEKESKPESMTGGTRTGVLGTLSSLRR